MKKLTIIIQTYNRAKLFGRTLESVCRQGDRNFLLKVFSNGCTDNTKSVYDDIVAKYPGIDAEWHSIRLNNGSDYLETLTSLMKTEWTMVFHDDDLMHPDYVAEVNKVMAACSGATIMVPCCLPSRAPDLLKWEKKDGGFSRCSASALAVSFFTPLSVCYPGAVYHTNEYKRTLTNGSHPSSVYGKIFDRVLMVEMARMGYAVIIHDRYVHYRLHAGQDTNAVATGPTKVQIDRFMIFFRNAVQGLSGRLKRIYDYYLPYYYRDLLKMQGEEVSVRQARLALHKSGFARTGAIWIDKIPVVRHFVDRIWERWYSHCPDWFFPEIDKLSLQNK